MMPELFGLKNFIFIALTALMHTCPALYQSSLIFSFAHNNILRYQPGQLFLISN